ncbi:D-psicose/D-tagatose/L-ribulose 3-epimerase [Amaricoccus macauensis]|uniref:D-psicose/D-tagatose/L-ribulose 3-epimerase n=1 Tax=Amaricoccus macauensis TaxID=57001 RepID=A0A840SL77_9RHOB|nr:sugar phosphate isomerase/epimerase family protein [Amaricoccus macauensis]MBB5221510.1 D-psicose/D-tagatose/L-ribulose 3-epimerase [Amaricoccus macauensis]
MSDIRNKLGVHSFVWEHGWSRDQATSAINQTAKAGFDFIEAPSLDPSSIDPSVTAKLLEEAGIGIAFSMGLDFESDISSGDPEKEKRGKALLLDAVRVCRDCGGNSIGGILYSGFGKYYEQPTAHGIRRSADILREVAEEAAKSDINLCLEVVNRYETNICNTAAQGVEMCKLVGAPNVKVHLDVYHMNIEESDMASAIVDSAPYIGYFHTGDSHRGYLGSGSIDLQAAFRAIVRAKYTGPITFESFSSRVVGQPLEGILGIWRNLWEDGFDLATHALMYTKAQLKAAQEVERQAERSRLPI